MRQDESLSSQPAIGEGGGGEGEGGGGGGEGVGCGEGGGEGDAANDPDSKLRDSLLSSVVIEKPDVAWEDVASWERMAWDEDTLTGSALSTPTR